MWGAIKLFFSSNTAKIIEWVGIIGGALATVAAIFNAGKKSAQGEALIQQSKDVERAHEIEDKNRANLHDGDAATKLQQDWSR